MTRSLHLLAAGVLAVLAAAAPAAAETFTVTQRGDPAPGACTKRDCSLREAVRAAHDRLGANTVELPNARKPYRLRLGGIEEDLGLVGDLDVLNDPLAIKHPGKGRATIDANGVDRVLDIHPGAPTTLRKLVIRGGIAGNGGAIRSAADLGLVGSVLTANEATNEGGGIDADAGGLEIIRSRIVRNVAGGDGGGGVKYDSVATGARIVGSTIAGNEGFEGAGGLYVSGAGGSMRIARSTLARNRAGLGGGILAQGALTVINSTVAANEASENGGGIALGSGEGLSLNAVTVARNVADSDADGDGRGAGLFRFLGDKLEVENSLLALNRLGTGARNDCDGSPVDSLGHNLVSTLGPVAMSGPACAGFDEPTDITGANPWIGELRRNGGPTKTIALRKRSPAINEAKRSTAPRGDQRGERRGKRKDIGAYEHNAGR